MRGDCVRFKDQILVAFAGMLAGSCIIMDQCIYFLKEGYRWEVVLKGGEKSGHGTVGDDSWRKL